MLNAFEKALLVWCLVKQDKKTEALIILDYLEMSEKSKNKNYEDFKINFDTIIEISNTDKMKDKTEAAIQLSVKTLTGKTLNIFIDPYSTVG